MDHELIAGMSLPVVGLGTLRLMGDECVSIVSDAIGLGYRHIDTARKYGNEEPVGEGIRRSGIARSEVIVTTKLDHPELAPELVGPAVESSLQRLGLDYVDILLIHWPNPDVPLAATIEAMEEARLQGRTRAIGVANFPLALLDQVAGLPHFVGNQVEYHPYLAQEQVLQMVRANGLVLTAYCPLGRGGELLEDPVLREIAADYGRSVPQIVLRWLVEQERVVVIPRSSNVAHLRENLDIFDFQLDPGARAAIGALARGARLVSPAHAPQWDDPVGSR